MLVPPRYQDVSAKLQQWVQNLTNKLAVNGIILFGSRARGDFQPYSDVDILVVADFGAATFFDRIRKVLQVPFDGPHIEAFCFTPQELEEQLLGGHVTVLDSFEEGKVLFGSDFFKSYISQFNEMKRNGLRKGKVAWFLPR
ncbi:MAG TPA: nucleotidyltransferase domain-containing protein [Candidatus Lokiarchaeia archaeon]|nr:nucleotidyltransferase domain-containing protein [Candidatus Lokiarchaeia archaeon]